MRGWKVSGYGIQDLQTLSDRLYRMHRDSLLELQDRLSDSKVDLQTASIGSDLDDSTTDPVES